MINTTKAAKLLNVSERTVRNLISRGRFPGAIKMDPKSKKSSWLIPENEIAEFIRKRNEIQN